MLHRVHNGFSFPNVLFHILKRAAVGLDSHKIPYIIIWDIYYLKEVNYHHPELIIDQVLRLGCISPLFCNENNHLLMVMILF